MDARRLTYRLSHADYAALAAVPRVSERWWLICLLATAALLGGVIGWHAESQRWLADAVAAAAPFGEIGVILVALAAGGGIFLLLRGIFRAIVTRRLERDGGEVRMTSGPHGLAIAGTKATRMLRWQDIAHVALHEDRIMLAAADGSIVLVPRSAFTDRAAMLSFAEAIDGALKADDACEEAAVLATGNAE